MIQLVSFQYVRRYISYRSLHLQSRSWITADYIPLVQVTEPVAERQQDPVQLVYAPAFRLLMPFDCRTVERFQDIEKLSEGEKITYLPC